MAEGVQTKDVYFAPQGPKYKVFKGPRRIDVEVAIDQDDRKKASVKNLMQFRLYALKSGYTPAIELAWSNCYDASTWIACYKGQVKIGEGFSMPKNPELKDGALILTEEQFNNLQGKIFAREYLEKTGMSSFGGNNYLPKNKVLRHPVWRALAGNKKLLQQHVNAAFKKHNSEPAMGICLADESDVPTQQVFTFSIGYFYPRSSFLFNKNLDFDACMVGVRSDLEKKLKK